MQKNINKVIIYILSAAASLFIFWQAVSPLFHPGLFPTIDNISVVRIESMSNALRAGHFPVRLSEDLSRGRGYMLFNFYAPLPFYTAAALYESGVNLVGSLKRAYLFAFIFAALGMFLFAKEFFGKSGGAVSSVFYTFSPFFGYDVYWRGGLGEVWAISFFPFLFWGLYKLLSTGKMLYFAMTSLAICVITLSHNLSTFIILPFAVIWTFYFYFILRKNILHVLFSVILGAGLSSFFWLPAFTEKSVLWVNYLQSTKSVFLSEFIQTNWLTMLFPTFIPMMINWVYLLIPIASIILVILIKGRDLDVSDKYIKVIWISAIFSVFSIFMATELSRAIWDVFYDYLYILQFSWRFFIITTFFSAFLAGFLAVFLSGQNRLRQFLIPVIMITGIVWYSLPNFRPVSYEFVDKYKAEDPCGTTWGYEYLPTWVSSCIRQEPYAQESIVGGDAKVQQVTRRPYFIEIITDGAAHKLRIEKYYYAGWNAYINEKKSEVSYSNLYGMVEVDVPAGRNKVVFRFEDTPLRSVSNMVSLVSLLIFVVMLVILFFRDVYKVSFFKFKGKK